MGSKQKGSEMNGFLPLCRTLQCYGAVFQYWMTVCSRELATFNSNLPAASCQVPPFKIQICFASCSLCFEFYGTLICSSSSRCVNNISFLLIYLLGNQRFILGSGSANTPQVPPVSCRGQEILEEHNEMDQAFARWTDNAIRQWTNQTKFTDYKHSWISPILPITGGKKFCKIERGKLETNG